MGVRTYFEDLYDKTKYPFCLRMLQKIKIIEVNSIESNKDLEGNCTNCMTADQIGLVRGSSIQNVCDCFWGTYLKAGSIKPCELCPKYCEYLIF